MTLAQRIVGVILVGGLIWFLGYLLQPTDNTDEDRWRRSGMMLYTDAETGCQYLRAGFGGLTPRMAADGRHMGCRKTP